MAMVGMNKHWTQGSAKGAAARAAACGAALAFVVSGCGGGGSKPAAGPSGGATTSAGANGGAAGGASQTPEAGATTGTPALPGGVTPVYPAGTVLPPYDDAKNVKSSAPYVAAMQAADSHHLKVWIETDLVKQWLAGPDQFNAAIQEVAYEAKTVPGVVGFKIADELGKATGSTTTPDDALKFLHDARAALHANAPGKLVAIDVIGYALGCMPGNPSPATKQCEDDQNSQHAAMTLDTIDRIVKSGYIDVLDVTTNMKKDSDYAKLWNSSRSAAEQAALTEAKNRHWDTSVVLNTRKALSWPTAGNIETADAAATYVPDFIDIPIAAGLKGVDVWSWGQKWGKSGAVVQLMSPGYTTNALWNMLLAEKAKGVYLYVHYTPSYPTPGGTTDQDMAAMATVFSAVFVAAGTG